MITQIAAAKQVQPGMPPIWFSNRPISLELVEAQRTIDLLCHTTFANQAAVGKILKTSEELLSFASIPRDCIGGAALLGITDAPAIEAFLKNPQTTNEILEDLHKKRFTD
jgi:hypothetical protein